MLKFRGAGQGVRALIAELVSGEIARALGLPVPEIVFADFDPDLARTEPDPEIHALTLDSAGLNLAVDYLPGSVTFDPIADRLDPELASRILWLDAYTMNGGPDRAQYQHPDVAPPAVAHRSWCDVVLSSHPRLGSRSGPFTRSVRVDQESCAPARCRGTPAGLSRWRGTNRLGTGTRRGLQASATGAC